MKLGSDQKDSGMGQNPEGTLVFGFVRTKIILRVLCQEVDLSLEEGGGLALSPSPLLPVCVCMCVCVCVCVCVYACACVFMYKCVQLVKHGK